jgi:hypothetical protein
VESNEIADLPGDLVGGGIYNAGTLTLAGTTVSGNSAGNLGGGIFNEPGASASFTDTTISGNQTTSTHPGTSGGGAIYNGSSLEGGQGTVTITHSIVSENSSELGPAGIWNVGGILTITESMVTANTSAGTIDTTGGAGGIFSTGTAIIADSTVSGNSTSGSGGGIGNSGSMSITGSTISGNSASSSSAAGIENGFFGVLTIENSTISGNFAGALGAGIYNLGTATITFTTITNNGVGNVDSPDSATLNLGSSIVANRTFGHDCGSGAFTNTEITSLGYNLIEDVSGTCSISGDTTGNIIGSDPMLGPLAFNGGSTDTHAVLAGSPVLDAGDPACPPPGTDQRKVPRPQGPFCEMGSWESPEGVALVQVDNTAILTITGRVATSGDIFCGPSGDTFRIFVRANQTSTGAITKIGRDSGPCTLGNDRWGVLLRRMTGSPAFQPGSLRVCYQARTYTGSTETDRLTACDTDVTLTN